MMWMNGRVGEVGFKDGCVGAPSEASPRCPAVQGWAALPFGAREEGWGEQGSCEGALAQAAEGGYREEHRDTSAERGEGFTLLRVSGVRYHGVASHHILLLHGGGPWW